MKFNSSISPDSHHLADVVQRHDPDDLCRAWLQHSEPDKSLLLVPSAIIARDLSARLVRMRGAGRLPNVKTLSHFIRESHRSLLPESSPRIISPAIQRAATEFAHRFETNPQIRSLTASQLNSLRADGGTVSLREDEDEESAISALRRVLDEYERLLRTVGADDVDLTLELSRHIIQDGAVIPWRNIILYQVQWLSRADLTLLSALTAAGVNMGISWIPEHYRPSMERGESLRGFLTQIGWLHNTQESACPALPAAVLLSTPYSEVRMAMAVIKETGIRKGQLPRTAIVCPSGKSRMRYRHLLRRISDETGVAIGGLGGASLGSSLITSAVFSLADIVIGRWRLYDVRRFLFSGISDTVVSSVEAAALLKVADECRIIGGDGPDGWSSEIQQRKHVAEHIISNVADHNTRSWTEAYQNCGLALKALQKLESLLSPLHPVNAMDATLDTLAAIAAQVGNTSNEMHARDVADLCTLTDDVRSITNSIANPTVSLQEIMNLLRRLVRSVPNEVDTTACSVELVAPEAALIGAWDLVLVPGCIQGEFPAPHAAVLSDTSVSIMDQARDSDLMTMLTYVMTRTRVIFLAPHQLDGLPVSVSRFLRGSDASPADAHLKSLAADPLHFVFRKTQPHTDTSAAPRTTAFLIPDPTDPIAGAIENVLSNMSLSPTMLDAFSHCQFKGYAAYILRLVSKSPATDWMTGTERGIIVHRTLHDFFRRLRQMEYGCETTDPVESANAPIHISNFTDAILSDNLKEIFLHHLAEIHLPQTMADYEKSLFLGTNDNPGLLIRWLDVTIHDAQKSEFLPAIFELQLQGELAGLPLRGFVDRVDVKQGTGGLEIRVIDYKTSAASLTIVSTLEGRNSQLPLYLHLSAATLEAKTKMHVAPSQAAYITFPKSLAGADRVKTTVHLSMDKTGSADVESLLDEIISFTTETAKQIPTGTYHAEPWQGKCGYCSFGPICRIQTTRS